MTRLGSILFLGALLFGVLRPTGLDAQGEPVSLREALQVYRSPDSLIRHNTWKRLDPEDSKQLKLILKILADKSWYDRQAAIDALAKAGSEKIVDKMVEYLTEHKNPFVRQGMAVGIAQMNDKRSYGALYEALKDSDPTVRRMVVHGLGLRNRKKNVDALVELFQTEEDPVVRTFIEHSLNAITKAFQGPDPLAWAQWWGRAKRDKDFKLGRTDEEAIREAERLGKKLKTSTRVFSGVRLQTAEKGSGAGVPILILPPYGYSREIMIPFLSELERYHKLYYIDLPEIKSFKGLKAAGKTTIPYYPVDKLLDAFESLRKKTGEEHFAIMSCGMNAWIAMRYAQKFPNAVAANIFVAPISSNREYGAATKRFKTKGQDKNDLEMFYFGLTRTFNPENGENSLDEYHRTKEIPKPDGQGPAIDRRSWSLFFKNEQDGLIHVLYPKKSRPLGSVAIPDFSLFKEKPPKRRIPTLVLAGAASLYTSLPDCKQIAKYYGTRMITFKNSSCMPFAEESELFNQVVAKFLKKYTRPREPAVADSKASTEDKSDDEEKKSRTSSRKKRRSSKKDPGDD